MDRNKISHSKYNPTLTKPRGALLGGVVGFGMGLGGNELVDALIYTPHPFPDLLAGGLGGVALAIVYGRLSGEVATESE